MSTLCPDCETPGFGPDVECCSGASLKMAYARIDALEEALLAIAKAPPIGSFSGYHDRVVNMATSALEWPLES